MAVAIWWGLLSSATLFIGQGLARPLGRSQRITGLIMGFGAGTLLSAISYELLPESNVALGMRTGLWLCAGALAYYIGDRLLDRRGGGMRHEIHPSGNEGSGMAMFLGALLDGVPEAFILGIGLAVGGRLAGRSCLRWRFPMSRKGWLGQTGSRPTATATAEFWVCGRR